MYPFDRSEVLMGKLMFFLADRYVGADWVGELLLVVPFQVIAVEEAQAQ